MTWRREREISQALASQQGKSLAARLDDPAHFIKLFYINDIHAGTKFVHSSLIRPMDDMAWVDVVYCIESVSQNLLIVRRNIGYFLFTLEST